MIYKDPHTANYDRIVYENKICDDKPKDKPMQQFIAFVKDLQDWNPAGCWVCHLLEPAPRGLLALDGARVPDRIELRVLVEEVACVAGPTTILGYQALYKIKDINKQFETILLTITQGVSNNRAPDASVNAYEMLIEQDVAYYSIDCSKLPGENLGWTIVDFHSPIKGPAKNVKNGIKPWITSRAERVPDQIDK
ncbi:hypothetical protein BGX28_006913 [Mortierella sp. GBA30]|nr:hypothetical protein BGX28_006913 [Mortierella sp. GBA30]